MSRPLIGIAMQSLPAVAGERPASWVLGRKYVQVLRAAGAVPVVVPLLPDDPEFLADTFARLNGVFLTGGVDVDPARYGEERHPLCGGTDPDRDAVELLLLNHARDRGLPVMAVCRGLQILNVAHGGTLYQDLSAQVPGALKHDHFPTPAQPSRAYLAHPISLEPGSLIAAAVGERNVPVNSMHHQAVKGLGADLRPTAVAPDGIVEGVEAADGRFVVGVQWHPEELADTHPGMARLFAAFVAAAV